MLRPSKAATSSAALAKAIDSQAMRCASRSSAPFVSCAKGPMILNGPSIRNSSVKICAGGSSCAMPACTAPCAAAAWACAAAANIASAIAAPGTQRFVFPNESLPSPCHVGVRHRPILRKRPSNASSVLPASPPRVTVRTYARISATWASL